MLRFIRQLFVRIFVGFRTLSAEQLKVAPPIFSDPEALTYNVQQIDLHDEPSDVFPWEFHYLLRNRLRAAYPHERGIFDCIKKTAEVIQGNQLSYVIYRRFTLGVFFTTAILMAPTGLVGQLYRDTSHLAFRSSAHLSWIDYLTWYGITTVAALLLYIINLGIKNWYDASVTITTANLAMHVHTYNNKLFVDGFKKCIDFIDQEAAEYGSSSDEKAWPERARDWAKLAFWNYRRIDQIERMTENYVWETQRWLSIVDLLSRLLNLLLFILFLLGLWATLPPLDGFGTPVRIFGQSSIGLWILILLVFVLGYLGWDQLGKEDRDAFYKSMLSPEKQELWIRSVKFRDEFANQIWKDKSRIQRDRPFRGGGAGSPIPAPLPHGNSH